MSLSAAVSKADCYVELKLPTASPDVSRTRVVDNSENPEWNETFQYRIHSAVKVRTCCVEQVGLLVFLYWLAFDASFKTKGSLLPSKLVLLVRCQLCSVVQKAVL